MVEWKTIGEICNIIRGNRVTKSDLVEDGQYPVISGGVSPLGYIEKYNREPNTITIAQYGCAGYVDLQKEHFWANDVCYSVYPKDGLLNMYLYYYLKNKQRDIYSLRTNAVPAHLPTKELASLEVPLPSLSEQTRIVGILDTFTASIENLKQQIEERRKQYEYYRDQLLDLEGNEGVEMKTMGEICGIFDGTHQTPKYQEEGVKFVSVENIKDLYASKKYISLEDYKNNYKTKPLKGDVLMTRIGDVGSCAVIDKDEPIAYYVSLALLRPYENIVLSNYIKYLLESSTGKIELRKRTLLTAVPLKINLGDIGKLKLPIPSLSEQSRIVSILDIFEASIANLEAQLKEREKQYEYYRNKLLTFE